MNFFTKTIKNESKLCGATITIEARRFNRKIGRGAWDIIVQSGFYPFNAIDGCCGVDRDTAKQAIAKYSEIYGI